MHYQEHVSPTDASMYINVYLCLTAAGGMVFAWWLGLRSALPSAKSGLGKCRDKVAAPVWLLYAGKFKGTGNGLISLQQVFLWSCKWMGSHCQVRAVHLVADAHVKRALLEA